MPYIPALTGRMDVRVNGKEDEDIKLKGAVQKHGSNGWVAITALVPGRTRHQCCERWYNTLDPSIDRTTGRKGKWTSDEDNKLENSVQQHGGKSWDAIASLVPGRTKAQCSKIWHGVLNPSIEQTNGRIGKWAEAEDVKLKGAVQTCPQTHGSNDWAAIALLVSGRTKLQCSNRWHYCQTDGTIARQMALLKGLSSPIYEVRCQALVGGSEL
jgi:hypothetical protein